MLDNKQTAHMYINWHTRVLFIFYLIVTILFTEENNYHHHNNTKTIRQKIQ